MSHLEELKVLSHLPIGDFAQESIDLIALHHNEEINETIAKLPNSWRTNASFSSASAASQRLLGNFGALSSAYGSAPDMGGGVS